MTTRIESGGPSTQVNPSATAPRTTDPPSRPFREVMTSGARIVVDGADAAVRRLPGGPVLAAALRPGAGSSTAIGSGVTASALPEGSTGTAASAGAASTTGAGIEEQLTQSADQNLYYLQLQERISAESREYSALSNVLKARHDTVKNAIGNIR